MLGQTDLLSSYPYSHKKRSHNYVTFFIFKLFFKQVKLF
jgi:hypothetical protein